MAYPTVSAPYGFKPVNLIGGQVFAGSTRYLPIQYNYGSNLYYGDIVALSTGFVVQSTITTSNGTLATPTQNIVGIFLGCTFTDPVTKQKRFSQYWPANTLAGDAQAIIADDPDQVFKVVALASAGTLASGSMALVGQNVGINRSWAAGTGNVNTGDSLIGATSPTSLTTTSAVPLRVIGLVPDTVVSLGTTTYTSISSTTITCAAIPQALPVGTDIGSIAPNGQYIATGSFIAAAASAGSTSLTVNVAPSPAITASATIVFNQYPEILVKFNQGTHGYYNGITV